MAKRRVQLMIDPSLYLQVKSLAGEQDKTYSEFAEEALREMILTILKKKSENKKALP